MILHLPAEHKSMLSEILSRWTSMPVTEVTHGDRIVLEPNHVYVPIPHSIVNVRDGHLQIGQLSSENARLLRPIDGFFDSLGAALRERAVGIVLSGTGSDGALGLKALKASGGFTTAQESGGTAPQYGEMPSGAIATGAVDLIAPVQVYPDTSRGSRVEPSMEAAAVTRIQNPPRRPACSHRPTARFVASSRPPPSGSAIS
jgi:two-component system CheB/CheR fusion protein